MSAMASQITNVSIAQPFIQAQIKENTDLCEGNPLVTSGFPSQRASNAEMFPFDDIIRHGISWNRFKLIKYAQGSLNEIMTFFSYSWCQITIQLLKSWQELKQSGTKPNLVANGVGHISELVGTHT